MESPQHALPGRVPLSGAHRSTGVDLKAALSSIKPPDGAFTRSISEAMSMVASEEGDPWSDA
jgi:hypothetical protein